MTPRDKSQLYENPIIWNQELQDYQRNVLQAYIDFFPEDVKSVLDLGCGDGKITSVLSQQFKNTSFHGFDQSDEALSRANFPCTKGDATNLPFQDNQFDMVMTIDLLEHLNDLEEEQCYKELFRVADKWVFLTVPFAENIEYGLTKCANCNEIYHVNYHQRSYSIESIVQRKVEGWNLSKIILSGMQCHTPHDLEISYRRNILNEWNGLAHSKCPTCSMQSVTPKRMRPLDQHEVNLLQGGIYKTESPYINSHSEIIAVFSKNESSLFKKHQYLSTKVSRPAAKIDFLQDKIWENLSPFPQVAKIANSPDNYLALQFPVYNKAASVMEFYIQTIDGSSSVKNNQLNDIIIEDVIGRVKYIYINNLTIKTTRPIYSGYYGVILRIPKNHKYKSIEFSRSPIVDCFYPSDNRGMNYFDLNNKLTIQVPEQLFFFARNDAMDSKSYRIQSNILMLCHDQDIDRRILAQARSLVSAGSKVTIIALSKDSNNYKKFIEPNIMAIFIGLSKIMPTNSAYLSYIARGKRIEQLMYQYGDLSYKILNKINLKIYLAHLFLKYHNWKFHDPLSFFTAFYKESDAIAGGVDLVQVHDLPTLEAGVAIAEQYNIPIIYDAHELYPEQKNFSSIQKRLCTKQEKFLIKKVNTVVTVNKSIAQLMEKKYKIPRPTVLLNSIQYQSNIKKSSLLHNKIKLPIDKKILLFQGGFSHHRNLENLIKAFCYVKSKDIVLVLLGRGDIESELRTKAQKYGLLGTRVYFLEAVAQDKLLQYTSAATMGIIPYPHVDLNSYYCTPNKLFEFIQAELPIIANSSPELINFVANEGFGVNMPMRSEKDIAKAVNKAFASDRYAIWKHNLKARKKEFSWEQEEKKYINIVKDLLKFNKSNSL